MLEVESIELIGKAQEKNTTYRTHKEPGPRTRDSYPRLYRTTALNNGTQSYANPARSQALVAKGLSAEGENQSAGSHLLPHHGDSQRANFP